jgi:hypothetical protein
MEEGIENTNRKELARNIGGGLEGNNPAKSFSHSPAKHSSAQCFSPPTESELSH